MIEKTETGSGLVFIYTTLPDTGTADRIGRQLVESRLAACVNIYPEIRSIYEWQGKVECESEVVAFIKTRADLADRAMDETRKLHPYEVPALLVLPIEGGNEDYIGWAKEQAKGG
ncbi:periplasmic divalent cation tolerance protein [Parvibaculum indicum]|uniref:divalent-cation tolerance protein CutA n=1 Tax=Parvibaculum indicum TaxID=562969 RepID=UPI001420EE5E|nr:divalent-cation tolerance protein CutA [Parvibaculum indicum]NIJ40151.1 periplasmic divalent cation tolerance protein [Parvibaculum indicum]